MLAAYLPGNRNVDLRYVPDRFRLRDNVLPDCPWIVRDLNNEHHRSAGTTDRWGVHPAGIVTHFFPPSDAAEAYRLADSDVSGKVGIVWQD